MRFERLRCADHPAFEKMFRLYEEGFPLHEQRTREKQERVLAHPLYHCEVIWEGETFAGLLLLWEGEDFLYVEHFAIDSTLRGQGVGSRALEELGRRGKNVILEIDPPVDEVARRRKRFYEKIGFCANPWPHVHPPYRPDFEGHELIIMTWPEGWPQERYERFVAFLAQTVMADCKKGTPG